MKKKKKKIRRVAYSLKFKRTEWVKVNYNAHRRRRRRRRESYKLISL
jgi:hypothetical protein